MVVQHRGGRENDEKADRVGVDHADDGIEVDPLQRAVCGGRLQQQGLFLASSSSSTSCAACQKNMYGLMVVPNIAARVSR